MASSPAPEAVASVDAKTVDVAPEKESKLGVNGHATISESALPDGENERPTVNGSGIAKDHGVSNGIASEDEKMADADAPVESATAHEEDKPESSVPDLKPEEPSGRTKSTSEPPKPESPNDVEMVDSKPDESQPAAPTKDDISAAPSAAAAADTTEKPVDASDKPEGTASFEQAAPPASDDAVPSSEVDLRPASLSQLELDPTEGDSSPVQVSVEVSMADAPSTKVVREREDDLEEEPAPKRAKTEPKEDDEAKDDEAIEAVTLSADGGTIDFPKPRFDEFTNWYDPEDDAKVITPFRKREMRRQVARIKKTKKGELFRDSVQRLWPVIWDKYSAKVEKPMDLSQIDRNLREDVYKTYGEFKADLALVLENSQQYNGPDHTVTAAARYASKNLWDEVASIPEEEPAKPKPPPKAPRMRESRSAHVKPEGPAPAETGGTVAVANPTVVATPAAKPAAGAADVRRASIATEGDRPKRNIRAPPSKDIDYTAKPSRKKLKPEMQFCEEVLAEMMNAKHWGMNQWFLDAVDAEGLGIPDYYSIIKHPMDLGKISRMLGGGDISSIKDFEKNVKLMFDNCYQFNGPPDQGGVSIFAKQLQDLYTSQMKGKDAWLAKHAKANPPPATTSNASDEEEEDDEEVEEPSTGPEPSQEVKDLEVRLKEEMDKQAALFAAEQPNQSMIEIQQGIITMVQTALLKAKSKLNEYRQKNGAGKPAKKAKPSKAKAGGGGGAARKAGGTAAVPRKPSAPKKKKNLTAADKDNIANAINDLEGPHLDRAIDIIKRDTGQMESEDGELELDIDQLSPEALLKLWELCKKILPGFGKDAAAAAKSSPEVHRTAPAKQAQKATSKSKKNKPMSAQEQEARIAQLREIQGLYHGGDPADVALARQASTPRDDSSDDSSEEE